MRVIRLKSEASVPYEIARTLEQNPALGSPLPAAKPTPCRPVGLGTSLVRFYDTAAEYLGGVIA